MKDQYLWNAKQHQIAAQIMINSAVVLHMTVSSVSDAPNNF